MFVIYGQMNSGKTHTMWLVVNYLLEAGTYTLCTSTSDLTAGAHYMTANVTVTINFAEQASDTYLDNVQSMLLISPILPTPIS